MPWRAIIAASSRPARLVRCPTASTWRVSTRSSTGTARAPTTCWSRCPRIPRLPPWAPRLPPSARGQAWAGEARRPRTRIGPRDPLPRRQKPFGAIRRRRGDRVWQGRAGRRPGRRGGEPVRKRMLGHRPGQMPYLTWGGACPRISCGSHNASRGGLAKMVKDDKERAKQVILEILRKPAACWITRRISLRHSTTLICASRIRSRDTYRHGQ